MRNRVKLLFVLVVMTAALGCKSGGTPIPEQPIESVDHTLFVYLGNLDNYSMEGNINGMIKGLSSSKIVGHIVIFYDKSGANTELIELKRGVTGEYERFVLKSYGENLNTSYLSTFELAVADLQKFTSSKSYSLILSSHGSAWVDNSIMSGSGTPRRAGLEVTHTYNPLTRAIADAGGYGSGLDLHDVADVLPDGMFDFLMFDACNMGAIEIVYALKDKVDFIIAAPSEVLIAGFPYASIIENIFDKSSVEKALTELCVKFFDTYKGHRAGCNIALYDCSMVDAVAEAFSAVVAKGVSSTAIPSVDLLQWFDGPLYPHLLYDMQEFAGAWIGSEDESVVALGNSLERMIAYAETTSHSQSGRPLFKSPVTAYCGVTIYVPQRLEYTNQHYMTTDWYNRVYGGVDLNTIVR